MASVSAYIRITMTVIVLAISYLCLQGQAVQPGLFKVGDPSPDLAWGITPSKGEMGSAGRIVSLALAPDGRTLYAAAEISGVWKSTDAARTWTQSSNGLRNGRAASHESLAVDGQSPNRLLFASGADDGRAGHPYGGLWVSDDSAGTWIHVPLCSGDTVITSVIFAGGVPYVATTCGLWTTSDAKLATAAWTELSSWPGHTSTTEMAAGEYGSLFTCSGDTAYWITNVTSPSVTAQSAQLGGKCSSLAPAFGDPTIGSAVVGYEAPPQIWNHTCQAPKHITCLYVVRVDFQLQAQTQLSDALSREGSGQTQVRTARIASAPSASGPGIAYDVYAADGCEWFALDVGPDNGVSLPASAWTFKPVMPTGAECNSDTTAIHADTWDMAFGPSYDPPSGNCSAFASTDGGVYANDGATKVLGGCVTHWVFAQSGLHALNTTTIAGVPLPLYPSTGDLFLPSGDNDVWARLNAKSWSAPTTWFQVDDGLGDAGQVLADPWLPTYAQLSRNKKYKLVTGPVVPSTSLPTMSPATEIVPGPSNAPCTSAATCYDDGVFGAPGAGGIAAVLTNPHAADATIDFVAVAAVDVPASPEPTPSRGPEMVLRCRNSSSAMQSEYPCSGPSGVHWTDVSPSVHFDHGIAEVLAAGGHSDPALYVLTPRLHDPHSGQIWRGVSNGSNQFQVAWTLANGTARDSLSNPVNFFVNPYSEDELYAVDAGDKTIKVSFSGGRVWETEPTLTKFATNSQIGTGNTYEFGCNVVGDGPPYGPYSGGCALSGMTFDTFDSNMRFAASEFGGIAFSRDGGHDWMALNVTNNVASAKSALTQQVNSVYFDYPRQTVYAGLHGGSLLSVKGPFPTLEEMTIVYPPSAATQVNVSVNPLGASFPLTKNPDGSFSGTVLFDSSKFTQLTIDFLANRSVVQRVTHVLTAGELKSGVATQTCVGCIPYIVR